MSAATLGREWLGAHLPHRSGMSLLDEIVAWDSATVRAIARRHREASHPLRRAGVLPSTAAIEYGAQAAAAHGALASGHASAPGLIASVRSVVFRCERLDNVAGDLEVFAEQVGAGPGGVIYRFELLASGRVLVDGRVAIAFVP